MGEAAAFEPSTLSEDAEEAPEKPELKDARQNPWYVLMTVAGEQDGENLQGDDQLLEYDSDLHARNKRYFNGWMAQGLTDEEKQALIEKERASEEDLAPLAADELAEIERQWSERCGWFTRLTPTQTDVNLASCEVQGGLFCMGFIFSGNTNFEDATFSGYADFQDATFTGYTNFEDVTFSGTANFQDATFLELALFQDVTFSAGAIFAGTAFAGEANFHIATFAGDAIFRDASFSKYAFFSGKTFEFQAVFQRAQFHGPVDFTDRTFKAPTDFASCGFHAEPPRYFNAELHEDTRWKGVTSWPLPSGQDAADRADDFIRSYERLKLLMASQNKVPDELMFQRLELRCREVQDGWFSLSSLGSRFFRWTSDYGWSLGKPLFWLCVMILAGALVLWGNEQAALAAGERDVLCLKDDGTRIADCTGELELDNALGLSFSNSFLFVGRTFVKEELVGLTLGSEIVSTVQMILGPFLIFLFGLAVRNRFRLK